MRLQDYDTQNRYTATVVSSVRITPARTDEIRELVLDLDAALDVKPGQSVGVLAPGQAAFGQEHHFRLYTIADMPEDIDGKTRIKLAVRRCFYVDEYSGEKYPGRASNYLCDLKPGDTLTLTGPYGHVFEIPWWEPDANLLLIGVGTGIAPFRAFLKHLYAQGNEFTGKVWLLHGARTGLDLLYQNDERDDLTQYFDRDTFQAIEVLAARPHWSDELDWGTAMKERGEMLWRLISDSKTYVYVAGRETIRPALDKEFAKLAGDPVRWSRRLAELEAGNRWVELLY